MTCPIEDEVIAVLYWSVYRWAARGTLAEHWGCVAAMVSVTGVMTWVIKVLPFLWCPAASAIRVLSTGGCVRNDLDVTQSCGAHGMMQTGIS